MAGQTITVSVLADTGNFSRAMSNLGNETGFSKLGASIKKLGKAVAIGVGALSVAGVAFGKVAVDAASDLQQSIGGVDAVFKESSAQIHKWAKSAAGDMGLSQDAYNQAATIIGTTLKNAGIPMDELGVKTNDLMILSSDLAATFGGSVPEATAAMGSALRGEFEPLRRFGISLNQADINARALTMSGKDNEKQLTKTEKALATQALMYEQSADAQGAFARESNTLAGQQERLKAKFENLKATVGTYLLPAMTAVTAWVSDNMQPAFEKVSAWVEKTGIPALQGLGATLEAKVMPIVREVIGGFQAMVAAFKAGDGEITSNGFAGVMERIGLAARAAFDYIKGTAIPALKDFGTWVMENKDWLLALGIAITTAVVGFQAYTKVMAIWRAAVAVGTAVQVLFNAAMAANPIGLIILAVAALVAGLVFFFTQTETGQAIFTTAWTAIQNAVAAVVDWWQTNVTPVLTASWTAITDAATAAAGWYSSNVAPVFEAFGGLVAAVFDKIAAVITWLWTNVWKPTIDLIVAYWSLLWSLVQAAWAAIGPPLIATITGAWNVMSAILSGVWETISAVFSGVWNQIKIIIETALGVIKGIIKTATALIKGDWSGAWNSIKDVFSTIWNGLTSSLTNYISTIGKALGGVKNTVTGAFSAAGTWLKDAGKAVIDGFINGVGEMFGNVKDKLGELTGKLTSWKGPESLDKVILKDAGKYVIQGFIKGLESEYGNVEKSLGGLTNKVSQTEFNLNPPTADFTPDEPLAGAANAAAATPIVVSLAGAQMTLMMDGRAVNAYVTEVADLRANLAIEDRQRMLSGYRGHVG